MRYRVATALAVAALTGCGGEETPELSTELVVRLDPDGDGSRPARETTVRCPGDPACRSVEQLELRDFAPLGGGVVCSGRPPGPQVATVTGTLDGNSVRARFTRADGCEIVRWRRLSWLLESA